MAGRKETSGRLAGRLGIPPFRCFALLAGIGRAGQKISTALKSSSFDSGESSPLSHATCGAGESSERGLILSVVPASQLPCAPYESPKNHPPYLGDHNSSDSRWMLYMGNDGANGR